MALKHVLLTVLNHAPTTGYGILKEFDAVLGFFWHASHQQIYRDLGDLTDAGFVRFDVVDQDDRPDKKVYRITAEGREELRRWVEEPMKPKRVRDELLVKLLAGQVVGPAGLGRLIAAERQTHERQLDVYREIEKEHFGPPPIGERPFEERMAWVALRRGILGMETWLAWAEEVEVVIDGLLDEPIAEASGGTPDGPSGLTPPDVTNPA